MTSGLALVAVAAGSSRRMGEIDKVWADLDGEPVLACSLRALAPSCDEVVLVVREDRLEDARALVNAMEISATVVAGGADRQISVRLGLSAVHRSDRVAVHDCARPLAPDDMLRRGLPSLTHYHGAVPALPVADTIKAVDDSERVTVTLDRTALRAVQTPQLFRLDSLARAHQAALDDGRSGTDDASLLEALGLSVCTFPGSAFAFKITTRFDLDVARCLAKSRVPAT